MKLGSMENFAEAGTMPASLESASSFTHSSHFSVARKASQDSLPLKK
jgi:hypothetical protein